MKAQVTKYKGRPIISLPTDKDYHFSFGKTKAKLILEHLDAIYEFAGVPKPNGKKPRAIKQVDTRCWHCNNGHDSKPMGTTYTPYLLCDCGATIIEKVGLHRKYARNKLGGIKVSWGR